MTQAELAERLKVSQPVVSDYENDVIRIPADMVVQLAEILGVSADAILGLKSEAQKNGSVKNRRLLRQVQAIDKLSKRDQQALLRTIDAFLSKVRIPAKPGRHQPECRPGFAGIRTIPRPARRAMGKHIQIVSIMTGRIAATVRATEVMEADIK